MADNINNPQDNFAYRQLLKAQKAAEAQINAVSRGVDELAAENRKQSRAADKRSPKETAAAKTAARRGKAIPEGDVRTPEESKQVARGLDNETAARKRATKATQEQTAANKALAASERRVTQTRSDGYRVLASEDAKQRHEIVDPAGRSVGKTNTKGEIPSIVRADKAEQARLAKITAAEDERSARASQARAEWVATENRLRGRLLNPATDIQAGPIGSTSLNAEERRQQRLREDALRQRRLSPGPQQRQIPQYAQTHVQRLLEAGPQPGEVRQQQLAERARQRQLEAASTEQRQIPERAQSLRERINQPPPAPVTPPPDKPQSAADRKLAADKATLARAQQSVIAGSAAERRALQETARTVGLSGDQFRRHGALTTEFISAAAKGQVTIRELGFQVGSTIGKFAGWTAAATAVYAAAGAVSVLGKGAIDSLSGVKRLDRVVTGIDTNAAQQQFRDLSREFNLPIDVVSEAAFEAARVFKDQDDIFAATKTTLGAVAVAELEAGAAGTYLNAIYRGLGGTAQDLAGTLDAANTITNKFGGNTGQIVEGTAKAAASFRAASKDGEGYAELLALIATTQAATGIGGSQAGTIIKRAAQNSQKPDRRAELIALLPGVTEDTSFIELVKAAQKEVAKPSTSKAKAGLIGSTIATPNLAAAGFQALLQSPGLLDQRLEAAQYAKAHPGSVKTEVETKLEAINEQIAKVGIELGALGSALGSSGALDGFGVLLKGLTTALGLATSLVEEFGKLPVGVRTAIIAFAQLRGILALIRRVDGGQALQGRFPTVGGFLRRDPAKLERAETLSGIGQQRASVVEESSRIAKARNANAFRQISAADRVAEAPPNSPLQIHEQERLDVLRKEGRDLTGEQEDLAKQHKAVLHQENEYTRRTNALRRGSVEEQRQIARSLGIVYTNPTLDQQSHLRPHVIDPTPAGTPIAGPARQNAAPGDVGRGAVSGPSTLLFSSGQYDEYNRAQNGLRDRIRDQTRHAKGMGRSAKAFTTAIGTAAGTLNFAKTGALNVGKGLKDFGGSLLASLGPLELIGIAALVAYSSYQSVTTQLKETEEKVKQLAKLSVEPPAKLIAQGKKEQAHSSLLEKAQNSFADVVNSETFGLAGAYSPDQAKNDAAADRIKTGRTLASTNKNGVGLTTQQIKGRLTRGLQNADEAEIKKVAAQAEREANTSRAAIYGEGPAAVKALKALRETIKNRVAQALLIAGEASKSAVPTDLKGLTEFTTSTLPTNIALDGLKGKDSGLAAQAIANARKVAKGSRDPETREKALAAIQAAEQAILTPAQEALDRLVKRAQSPKEQASARKAFASTIKRTYTGRDTAKGNDLIAEENRKQLDAELAAADARSSRVKSETADPVAQAQEAARASGAKLAKVSAAYKQGLVAIDVLDNAAAANNDALRAASDARVSDAESQRSLATSQFSLEHFTDQKATLQRALTDANAAANTIRAEGDQQSPAALRNALAAVNGAKQAIAEYARSQAQELLAANAEYAKSKTDDPVKQAEIDAKLAKDQEKFATTKAERRAAKANTNNARKAAVDTRITSKSDTIDFNLTMEKITRDEAIRQLESLSKSAGITKQTRRSILTRIKALKDEGSKDTTAFNLGVGDIKLPTVYDVRRGIASVQAQTRGGPATSRANAGSSSSVTANVVVNVTDANSAGAVYDAIDRALRTSVRSRMRNAGVR